MNLYEFIVWTVATVLLGIPAIIFLVFVLKRLREISIFKNLHGELYISNNKAFSSFFIPISELKQKQYILLEVHDITEDEERNAEAIKKQLREANNNPSV